MSCAPGYEPGCYGHRVR